MLNAFALSAQCKGIGAELGIHQQTVQSVCDQFATSRDQHRRCPKFRSSFGLKRARGWVPFQAQSRRIDGNSVVYKVQRYRFFGAHNRPVPDSAKSGAFVEDALGRWWVVFYADVQEPALAPSGAVGIDLGLKTLATLSDGVVIENPRHVRRKAERLATAQRAKNKRRAARLNSEIANARRDFHHKLSTRLSREYAFIAVGNVNAKRLAKTKMAKSIFDAGWSALRHMLRYKAVQFVEVDEKFTTQTCSECGSLPPSRPKGIADLGVRAWECSDCGARHDRDVNAAQNILRLARGVPRLGEESRHLAA